MTFKVTITDIVWKSWQILFLGISTDGLDNFALNLMNPISTIFITILALVVAIIKFIQFTKDVPDLYLSEQSIIADTCCNGESRIYKSNKLDFGKLRPGLDIRYDSYKLRSGNLSDIYYLFLKNLKDVIINDEIRSNYYLNGLVQNISEKLIESNVTGIRFHTSEFMINFNSFVLIIAGFINQITIIVDDSENTAEPLDILPDSENAESLANVPSLTQSPFNNKSILSNVLLFKNFNFNDFKSSESSTFVNEYTPSKDKGTALKLVKSGSDSIKTIEFTQLNLISAIASNLKHLPLENQWNDKDTLLVAFENPSLEELSSILIKILSTFVSNSKLVISNLPLDLKTLNKYDPTLLSTTITKLPSLPSDLTIIQKFKKVINLFNFNLGKLSGLKPIISNLRIIYITKPIESNYFSVKDLRAIFGTRIIIESIHYKIIGPIILNDLFDYRDFKKLKFKSFGTIFQSLEIKLSDFKKNNGSLMLRGYNIGKTTNYKNGIIQVVKNCNNDGFLPLNDVNASWGKDGCLYVN